MSLKKRLENKSPHHRSPVVFWGLFIILLLLLAGSVSFLSDSSELTATTPIPTPKDAREPRFYTVTYKSGVFSPTNLRIRAGDTVRFKNESFFGIRIVSDSHPAHNLLPGFDSVGDVPQSSYFSYTFSESGIYGYHNENNLEEQGTIIVRE